METIQHSAPDSEAQLNDVKQQVTDFAPEFSRISRRADRSRVKTRNGTEIGDPDLRSAHHEAEIVMNSLLDVLFKEMVDNQVDDKKPLVVNQEENLQAKEFTTVRFQMPDEPIPEFHDEYIVIVDDEDLGRVRKFEV